MKERKISKSILIVFAIYNLLLIYFLVANIYSLPMVKFINNPKTYAISSLIITIPSIIYSLKIIEKGLSDLFHKKMSINLIVFFEILITLIYSVVNTILISKGHNELTNNLYYIPLSLLIFFTNLSNYILKDSYNIIDKKSNNYTFFMIIVSLIITVCYLELGLSFTESMNTLMVLLSITCPLTLSIIYAIALNISKKKCHKNGLNVDYQMIYEANKAEEIVIKMKKEARYSIDNINNYSKYSDEELLSIVASIESNFNNKYAVAFNKITVDKSIKDPKEIPGIGVSGRFKKTIISIGNEKILEKKKIKNIYEKSITRLLESDCKILYVIEKKDIIGIVAIKEIIPTDNRIIAELKKLNKKVVFLEKEREIDEYVMRAKEKNIKVLAYTNEDTSSLSFLFKISKKCHRIITENLLITFLINMSQILIVLKVLKIFSMNPLCPIIVSFISLLIIILNSLRLNKKAC